MFVSIIHGKYVFIILCWLHVVMLASASGICTCSYAGW